MDIYLDNTILECNAPRQYRLHIEDGYTEEDVPYENMRLMQFDTGYMLCVAGVFRYIDFEENVSLKLYRDNEQILEFHSIETITKEKDNLYRFFCRFENANSSEALPCVKESGSENVTQEESEKEIKQSGLVQESIDAIYEKYFSQKDEKDQLRERRRLRRRQAVASSESDNASILGDLNRMIGLNAVKMEVKKMVAVEEQRAFLESIGMAENQNDMLFLGNPGTGKTSVARYLTEILYKMGKIRENKCVEINGHDLMGSYIGQTASTVERYLREARGGVLFIDEAYSLLDGSESFASDAITKLLGALTKTNRDFVCILAGYENEMKELMSFNVGFESRVATKLYFENYTVEELGEIFCNLIKSYGYTVEKEALKAIMEYFETVMDAPKFSNGRFVRNLFEKLEEEHCRHFDGLEEEADVFRVSDLTDEIKHALAVGIM